MGRGTARAPAQIWRHQRLDDPHAHAEQPFVVTTKPQSFVMNFRLPCPHLLVDARPNLMQFLGVTVADLHSMSFIENSVRSVYRGLPRRSRYVPCGEEIDGRLQMDDPVKLETKDYFLGIGNQVLVRNGRLIEPLVKETATVIQKLSQISPITLDKIMIDQSGNVIIADPNFRSAVEGALNMPGALSTNVGACINVKSCLAE